MQQANRKVSRKSRFRLAIVASVIAHCVALAALLYIPYRVYYAPPAKSGASRGSAKVAVAERKPATDSVAAAAPETLRSPEEEFDRNFDRRLQQSIDSARERPPAEQRADLQASGETLAAISSEESIDEIADKFQQLNKTSDRAVTPAEEQVAGPFDYNTAQIHDVQRSGEEPGGYAYQATLLDAAGRTTVIPLEAVDGKSLYQTMQMVKQNPLMEKVYRQIMMPMLDQMIDEKQKSETAP